MRDFDSFIYKDFDFNAFSDQSWKWLQERMQDVTVHICCQSLPEEENPDDVYIYLNRKHQNGKAFRWYINGLTPDLLEISEGVKADVYAIPSVGKDKEFVQGVLYHQRYAYIDYFKILQKAYPALSKHYKREAKELPNSGVAAMLLCNLLPIKKCLVHGLDLYWPHFHDYKENPQGKKPPHSEDFDLSCFELLDKKKFKVSSKNPKVLQAFNINNPVILNKSKRRDALLLITDNGFAVPTAFFIHNFIEKNPWFVGDVVVMYSENIAPLNEESMSLIRTSGYAKIEFVKVDETREIHITDVASGFTSQKGYHSQVLPSILTVEAFNHELWGDKYDKTLLLDPDMLVNSSLEDIFSIDVPIMVTEDTTFVDPSKDPSRDSTKQFNGGFVMVNHQILAKTGVNISDAIFEFFRNYKKPPKLFEQSIMNDFFEHVRKMRLVSKIPFDITFAPDRTQLLKRCIPDTAKGHILKEGRIVENSYDKSYNTNLCKIVHYVGSKPWQYTNKKHEEVYQKCEKLWFAAFEKLYKTNSAFAKSDVLETFMAKNPRVTKTLKGDLKYRPPDSVNRVNNLKKDDVLRLFQKEKNYEKGFSLYNQAKAQYTNWPALKREFGYFLIRHNRAKDFNTAFALFAEAFKDNPKSTAAAAGAVIIATKMKDKKVAINYLKKVQRLSPNTKTTKKLEEDFIMAFTPTK